MALTFTPFLPRALNNLPEIPGVRFMFSPTIASTESPFSTSGYSSFLACSSSSNSLLIKDNAFSASVGFTAKVMLCSEEDWVISTTFTCSLDNRENSRPLNPALPTIPLPERFRILISSIEEIPFMGKVEPVHHVLYRCRESQH